jgi:hypothetical protein
MGRMGGEWNHGDWFPDGCNCGNPGHHHPLNGVRPPCGCSDWRGHWRPLNNPNWNDISFEDWRCPFNGGWPWNFPAPQGPVAPGPGGPPPGGTTGPSALVPLVPGPKTTDPYEYLIVRPPDRCKPPVFGLLYSTSDYLKVESALLIRGVPADRKTLLDGKRVYRVLTQYLWRLRWDRQGAYLGFPPRELRFHLQNPTLGMVTTEDFWMPIY